MIRTKKKDGNGGCFTNWILVIVIGVLLFFLLNCSLQSTEKENTKPQIITSKHKSKMDVEIELMNEVIKWAVLEGLEMPPIKVVDGGDKGRSAIFTEDYNQTVLFKIPYHLVFNSYKNTNRYVRNQPGWTLVHDHWNELYNFAESLLFIYENQIQSEYEQSKEAKHLGSFFSRWLKIFPQHGSETGIPYYWTKEELNWLEGVSIEDITKSFELSIIQNWKKALTFLTNHPNVFNMTHFFTKENFIFATYMTYSRAFNVPVDDSGNTFLSTLMTPVIDLANHNNTLSTNWDWNDEQQYWYLEVYDREWKAGDELQISYGQASNYGLLSSFGFCLEENIYDEYYLVHGLINELEASHDAIDVQKISLLKEYDYSDWLILSKSSGFQDLMIVSRIITCDDIECLEAVSEQLPNCDLELRAVDWAHQLLLKEIQTKFSSSIEDDEKLIREGKFSSFNIKHAVFFRLGMKKILRYYQEILSSMKGKLNCAK